MNITRLRLSIVSLAFSLLFIAPLFAGPPVETVKASELPHVAHLWQHGGDIPFGISTSASPPKPLIIKGPELPYPYKAHDSMFWDEYRNDGTRTIKPGDLFVFIYKGALTVRPVAAVTSDYVQTPLGTKVAMADVKGTVRRVIRVVDDLKPSP